MKFLDVKTDFAFKKVFGSEGSKDILLSFLNSLVLFAGVKSSKTSPSSIPIRFP